MSCDMSTKELEELEEITTKCLPDIFHPGHHVSEEERRLYVLQALGEVAGGEATVYSQLCKVYGPPPSISC